MISTGVVKEFSRAKGWGFITSDSGKQLWFKAEDLEDDRSRDIRVGQRVQFVETIGAKGAEAREIKKI